MPLPVDGAPVIRSHMRFDVSGPSGSIERAQLRVLANSNSAGHDAHSASNSRAESTLTYGNAPPPSATVFGSTKGGGAGTWTTTDVTPMVAGNGTITVALDTRGTSAVNSASRESGNPPQLVID